MSQNSKFKIQNSKFRDGFTLIELLIVIAIIGALTTVFFTNYLGAGQRARDSQRKSDLRQIQSALELARLDTGVYPSSLYSANCPTSSPLVGGAVTYMQKIPCDPLNSATYYNGGNYYYTAPGGTSYTLCACLENTNDNQGGANSTCGAGVGSVPIAASSTPITSASPPHFEFFPKLANLIQESVNLGKKEESFRSKGAPIGEVAGVSAPTPLGYDGSTEGFTNYGTYNRMRVSKLSTIQATQEGVVSQGKMYLKGSPDKDATFYMVVYRENAGLPGSLAAVSNGILVPTTQTEPIWVTFDFPSFDIIDGQHLWLGFYSDGDITGNCPSNCPAVYASESVIGDYANDGYVHVALETPPVPNPFDQFGAGTDTVNQQRSWAAHLIIDPPPASTPTPTQTPPTPTPIPGPSCSTGKFFFLESQ